MPVREQHFAPQEGIRVQEQGHSALAEALDQPHKPLRVVGVAVAPASLTRLDVPAPELTEDGLVATAVLVDRFGNVALNLSAAELEAARFGERLEVECGGERYFTRVVRTFSSVRPSDILVLIGSYGQVARAGNSGSAAEVLGLQSGDRVRLRRAPG